MRDAGSEPSGEKRWCVVIDTNQWISHLMLRSPTAAALLYSLRQQDGVIGLPYVLEEELKRLAFREGARAVRQIDDALGIIRRLLGSAPVPTIPSDEVLRSAASRRLHELAPLLQRTPFTFDQASDALERLLDKVPPNAEKNQQYKDTLIWVAALELASEFKVVLVTSDLGFYADRKVAGGLARELRQEVASKGLAVEAVAELHHAADLLRVTQPPVDLAAVVAAVVDGVMEDVRSAASQQELVVGDLTRSTVKVFATENPDVLAVTFALEHALEDVRAPGRQHARVSTNGECLLRDGLALEVSLDRIDLDWTEPSGEPGRSGVAFVRVGTAYIGERHDPYTVRQVIHE